MNLSSPKCLRKSNYPPISELSRIQAKASRQIKDLETSADMIDLAQLQILKGERRACREPKTAHVCEKDCLNESTVVSDDVS